MATTQNTYTGNGSTTNYTFSFEYIAQSDVKVTLDTVATTAYTFANATTLSFTTAPANGVAIRIYRDTNIDNLQSTFFPGSAIKAEDLNNNFTQSHFAVQETDNEVITANTTASSAVTTANSAVTTANSAVTTANSADTKSDAAVATANTASTTAGSAVTTANAATTTANSASSSAASAVSTANAADTKADTAISTANTASSNASTAVSTSNSANTAAANAVTTADAATVTANNATTTANSAVTTANTANTNATAAQSAATTAQASATAAQTSATAAQTSATAAQAQATLAADVRNAFTITDSNSDGTFDFVVGDIPIKGNNGVKLPFESVTYAEEGAIRYNNSLDKIELYNGAGQWVTAAGGAAVSSSPPSLPSAGDVWYDHDNGRAYVYYNDGDSNQWVEMNPSWNGYVADNSITSAKILDGSIVNADINVNAAIDGTKVNPDFGSQNIVNSGTASFGGNVGIGTTNAVAFGSRRVLAVANGTTGGVISLYNSTTATANPRISSNPTGSEINNIGIHAASTNGSIIAYTNNDTERMRIDSSGRLLVGTTTAGSGQLTVASTSHTGITIRSGNTSTNSNLIFADAASGADVGVIQYSHSTDSLRFTVNNGERLRIDSSGRVGIGITTFADTATALVIKNSASGNEHTLLDIVCDPNETSRVRFSEDGSNFPGEIKYDTLVQQLSINVNSAERLRIDDSGKVGIGTSSPVQALHVAVASNDVARFESTTFNGSATIEIKPQSSSGKARIDVVDNAADFSISTVGQADALIIRNDGFVSSAGTLSSSTGLRAYANSTVGAGSNIVALNVPVAYAGNNWNFINCGIPGSNDCFTVTKSGTTLVGPSSNPVITLDSTGRLLVGTSSAISGSAANDNFQLVNSAGSILSVASSDTTIGGGTRIGELQFWGQPNSTWGNFATIGCFGDSSAASNDNPGRLVFSTTADGASSPTERMRIDRTGRTQFYSASNTVEIGTAAGADTGSANALLSGRFGATSTHGGGTDCIFITSNGNIYNTNNSYGSLSDAKLKENIVDANSQWDDIKGLRVRNYNFIEGQTHTQIGVVAQEVETLSPGLVTESPDTDDDGNNLGTVTKSVNYSVLYMKAVKALQEAMERIETLETKVNALEGA